MATVRLARRRLVRGVATGVLLVVGAAGVAGAHTRVVRSEPAAGARLAAAPTVVRIQFSETAPPALARLTLIASAGDTVALSPLRQGTSGADVVEADVEGAVAPGAYRVEWRLVGKDGHAVTGRIAFTVVPAAPDSAAPGAQLAPEALTDTVPPVIADSSMPALAGGEPESAVTVLDVAVKFLGYAAMLLVIGATTFMLLVLPRVVFVASGPHSPWLVEAAEQARRLGRLGALVLLVVAPLRLAAQMIAIAGGEPFGAPMLYTVFAVTTWGDAWLLQLVAAILVVLALGRRRNAPPAPAPPMYLLVPAVVALAISAAMAGHALAAARVAPPVAVALDTLHVLAAGMWVGALLALVAAGIPAALRLPLVDRGGAARALLASFSAPALGGAALLALTGATSAWIQIGSLSALWSSAYGRWLLVKLALVALVLAAGAWNWRVVQPSLGTAESVGRARRSAMAEAALMLLVLLVTAILTSTPPPPLLAP